VIRLFFNPSVAHSLPDEAPTRQAMDFHKRLPAYAPTPLFSIPALAQRLGLGKIWVKDESNRYGLPSFKILGAWWATYRMLIHRFGRDLETWSSIEEFRKKLDPLRPLELVAATDGNHGRAVARIASLLKFSARIFVPGNTATARIEAIRAEGAEVAVVSGSYEDALAQAVKAQGPRNFLLQDLAWPGYEEIPRWTMEGYSTIFWEADDQLKERGESGPDLVVAQIGGGSFAAAAVRHFRRPGLASPPRIVGIEPTCAASTLASLEAGRLVTIPGPHTSIMAGLNCGTVSSIAWPILKSGLDGLVSMGDERVGEAMRFLAQAGLVAGETGASGAACLLELLDGPQAAAARQRLSIDRSSRVLLVSTEGATDPQGYKNLTGQVAKKERGEKG
jgi:diaminopropionate ammonia-lyase